jgi:hypothetical protein
MSRRIILASFAQEGDLLRAAVEIVRKPGWQIADIYTPYAVHGLEEALGWRRSWLPVACFLSGAAGVLFALWFQFWTTARDWPLNVGGQPWNSLPAFVPATFESMVLTAGFGVVFAWLLRSRHYPGKRVALPLAGLTDDRFALVLRVPDLAADDGAVRQMLLDCRAVSLEERSEEEQP